MSIRPALATRRPRVLALHRSLHGVTPVEKRRDNSTEKRDFQGDFYRMNWCLTGGKSIPGRMNKTGIKRLIDINLPELGKSVGQGRAEARKLC